MKQRCMEQHGENAAYTCMLWNVQSGRPIVVTIQDEHPDRWFGRRCVVTASSFEAPLEMFMKTDWRRSEPSAAEEPREDAAAAGGPAAAIAAAGAAAVMKKRARGFHP